MADQSDAVLPWTIKGIGPEARNAATKAAQRERQTIGDWLTRAILAKIQSDRHIPAVIRPESDDTVRPASDLDEIERLVGMIRELSGSGAEVPKGVARSAYSVVRRRLAELRGRTLAGAGRTSQPESPTTEA